MSNIAVAISTGHLDEFAQAVQSIYFSTSIFSFDGNVSTKWIFDIRSLCGWEIF